MNGGPNAKCIEGTYKNTGTFMLCSDHESIFSSMLTSRAWKVDRVERLAKIKE